VDPRQSLEAKPRRTPAGSGGAHAGLAVAAANARGPAEIIRDGVNGVLFEPGNVSMLAQAIKRLTDYPEFRVKLGEAGVIRSVDFTPEASAPRVLAVYRSVLAEEWPTGTHPG
jgi:glycosyltransferase involved in cell wall biosynthesis